MLIISRKLRQDKITLFNAIEEENENELKWQITMIERVRLENGRSMRLREKGIESSEKALLIIDLRDCKTTDGRKYATAKVWENYEEGKKNFWTIRSSLDFFIPNIIPVNSRLGKEELMNKYEVLSITDISEEKGSSPDIEILKVAAK
jgi:hypothetical protein